MKKPKIALCSICLNVNYWEYAPRLYDSIDQFFFADGSAEVDKFLWTDMPEPGSVYYNGLISQLPLQVDLDKQIAEAEAADRPRPQVVSRETAEFAVQNTYNRAKIYPSEGAEWPLPTLMRYHLYLRAEEELKNYDYIFHIDIDMLMVSPVGQEILGNALTMAQHPMYALSKNLWMPFDSNPMSQAYVPQMGRLIKEGDMPRFQPLYAAGGFQGGKSENFIKAMKTLKRAIDQDHSHNYIARWNDESHWNRYLYDHPEEIGVVLDPGYIYPDSLINEYYVKIWGRNYEPKIITLTKKFTTTKEGGKAVQEHIRTL